MLPVVKEEFKGDIDRFRSGMRAEGFTERQIDKMLKWAEEWTQGISGLARPEKRADIERELFDDALIRSPTWLRRLREALAL